MTARRITGYLLATVLLLSTAAGCRGRKAPAAADSAGVRIAVSEEMISASRPDTVRLGVLHEGEKVKLDLFFANDGDRPFVIENINSGCGCLLFGYSKEPAMPGAGAAAELTFNSAGLYGEIIRLAYVYTTLSPQPRVVAVEATVE